LGNFSAIMASLRGWWSTATPVTRAAATGLALFVGIGLWVAVYMATAPDYVPIYHNVSGKDASAMETALTAKGITMHYENGTVSVPSKDKGEATMDVEASGAASKDSSVDGLDKIQMGTSTDVEHKRILNSDEHALENKLMDLDPVATAAVTISPGSDTDLFTQATPPTASVILGLKSGESLNDSQVKGIVNLVAHAVTGLTAQNVTLTDQTGTPLWKDNGQGGNAFGDGEPLNESQKYAESKRKQIQSMLDATIGPRKSVVTVNAELNFDQTQTHSIEHTPVVGVSGGGLPISVREKNESMTGNPGSAAGGQPAGTGSNLAVNSYAASGSGASGGGNYKSTDSTTNYAEPNMQDTITQRAPGAVKLLTVAALVDTSVEAGDMPKIKDIIAANISATPGDTARSVTVQQLKFDNTAQKAEADQVKSLASQAQMETWARYIGIALGFCVLMYLMMRSSGGGVVALRRQEEPRLAMVGGGSNIGLLEDIPEASLEPFMQDERPLRVEDVLAEMPEVVPRRTRRRPSVPSIEEQHDLKMESIQEMIATNAEAVALLLKGWMAEETKFLG